MVPTSQPRQQRSPPLTPAKGDNQRSSDKSVSPAGHTSLRQGEAIVSSLTAVTTAGQGSVQRAWEAWGTGRLATLNDRPNLRALLAARGSLPSQNPKQVSIGVYCSRGALFPLGLPLFHSKISMDIFLRLFFFLPSEILAEEISFGWILDYSFLLSLVPSLIYFFFF